MREAEFKAWLQTKNYSAGTISTQMSKVRKLDRVFGDLDLLHERGEFDALEVRLQTGEDLPSSLGNDGERDHLPTSLRYYRKFLEAGGRMHEGHRDTRIDEAGFRDWLEANYSSNTVRTKLSGARKLAKAYGDLSALYEEDKLESVMQSLRYTAADRAQNSPNPSKVNLTSDLYRDLGNLRTTVNYYKRYHGEQQSKPDRDAVNKAIDECALLGTSAFLDIYGFGASIDYWVVRDGARYPSKAVFGVAHQFMPGGTPLDGKACDGTAARRHLEKLGFEIVEGEMPGKHGTLADQASADRQSPMPYPINLILYGPPGTGKTWRTAEEAVKLCDGSTPADRHALMDRYSELIKARRIDFVTFHQSYSYEEFVEGLRPQQGGSEFGSISTESAGFSLVPEEGVFRRIAHRATASRGGGGQFAIGARQVFKLSIGEAARSEDDYLFEEALAQGYVLLGYDDIDWSNPRFGDRDAFIAACREYDREHPENGAPEPTAHTGRVQCPLIFRNWIKRGDLVIVSKGNSKFRAVGEVTGDYEYAARESGVYPHRRKVNWLWIDKAGAPVDDIYAKGFSMRAVYLLARSDLIIPALEGYINGQLSGVGPAEPEPYVLIIDEINRGNISKIFGELITLIEPDKRSGMPNAIEVRLPYSKEAFSVPGNLHIVGTMNTADRSIALLDTALRRRFLFREIAPDPLLLPQAVEGVPLRRVLETINDRIEYLIDREHRIGHAFFLGESGKDRAAIDATMRDKVIPLLQEYFFEDWSRIAAVLGEPQGKGGGFLDCRKLRDPTGQGGEERESWSVRYEFASDAYDRLVGNSTRAVLVEDSMDEAAE
ncbi:AAA family ATPase [Labrys neptuniae]|uniref:AAA family ATPase n=1 Tax=Labrys neptuniae TaxID=376174 RepID=A0ABV3PIZ8_9HYPH